MSKHTIELDGEELVLINVVKSLMGLKSIDKAISFILKDYAKDKDYNGFINKKKKEALASK